MESSNALILFAKQPFAGRVKTRLSPPLTPETGAELYSCMLRDTIATAMALPDIFLTIHYQDDPGAAAYFAALAPGIESQPQRGEDLGKRMEHAFDRLFRHKFDRVAIIGSDSPDLPAEYILRAYELLDGGADAVFGPADDGGYYLLAISCLRRELFSGLPWSSSDLLESSLGRARKTGIRTALLPQWYDLDTCDDLDRIIERGGIPSAPLTDAFLRGLDRSALTWKQRG